MNILNYLFVALFFIISYVSCKKNEYVTYGSVLKLINVSYQVRLHSHDVNYATGSGQQSVTGVEQSEDVNSHWIVKAETNKVGARGEAVKCNDVIRLEHLATGKNLHSHSFSSPLSGRQEVSAYGDNGVGDTGDHWQVICDSQYWERDEEVKLKHIDTKMFLSATGKTYGNPIVGQSEIVGVPQYSSDVEWKAMEGLFIHRSNFNPKVVTSSHDEL